MTTALRHDPRAFQLALLEALSLSVKNDSADVTIFRGDRDYAISLASTALLGKVVCTVRAPSQTGSAIELAPEQEAGPCKYCGAEAGHVSGCVHGLTDAQIRALAETFSEPERSLVLLLLDRLTPAPMLKPRYRVNSRDAVMGPSSETTVTDNLSDNADVIVQIDPDGILTQHSRDDLGRLIADAMSLARFDGELLDEPGGVAENKCPICNEYDSECICNEADDAEADATGTAADDYGPTVVV